MRHRYTAGRPYADTLPGPDPQITTQSVLRVFVERPEPAFVAPEIADALDCSRQGAKHRLDKLVDEGLLASKTPGKRTKLFWITEAGRKHYFEVVHDSGGS